MSENIEAVKNNNHTHKHASTHSTVKPVTAIIVGAGHRSLEYARYAQSNQSRLKIVGVADPDANRRKTAAELFNIPSENCFSTAEELAKHPVFADAVINGTMDKYHYPTSIPLLEAGYHLLLEKPIGISKEEVLAILNAARKYNRIVMVCHVLRYAPFYVKIKERILSGRIGTILNIQTAEYVSYHHASVAYIRGKWNNKHKCGSSMLMAKCCHDMDLITWMKSGVDPQQVSSFGNLMYFRREKAPARSGTRCLVDCPIEKECLYSAGKIYLDHPNRWGVYVWSCLDNIRNPSLEDKRKSLETDNPHGRCVWKCDNDVVDHQSVMIEFSDGTTVTHNLISGTCRPCRRIHIVGTQGEIHGVMEDGYFDVLHPDPSPGKSREYASERVTIDVCEDMHGGGDLRLVEDFVNTLMGENTSISSTRLEDSIWGHMIGIEADISMQEHRTISLDALDYL